MGKWLTRRIDLSSTAGREIVSWSLSEEGDTFVITAGETFKLLHTNPLGEMAQATPALVGERLLIRTDLGGDQCVDPDDFPTHIDKWTT